MNPVSPAQKNPLDFASDDEFGEWMHSQLKAKYGFEKRRARLQRVHLVANRLQAGTAPEKRKQVEIIRMREVNAFVGPGRYIYITRELLRRLPCEDAIAFVIGHEIGHAALGHLDVLQRVLKWKDLPGGDILAVLLYITRRLASSPEWERDADAHGLDLSLKAGYSGEACLKALDVLEAYLLQQGADTLVYGPESSRKQHAELSEHLKAKAQEWAWERLTGYPSIQKRKAALKARLQQHQSGALLEEEPMEHSPPLSPALRARLEPIDAALDAWHEDLALAAAEMTTLTWRPAYRKLTGRTSSPTELTGESRQAATAALDTIQDFGRQTQRMFAILDRAEELRASLTRHSPSETALRELETLLLGATESCDSLSPGKTSSAVAREPSATPLQLLNRMMQKFEQARDTIEQADAVWSRWSPMLQTFQTEAGRLEQAVLLLNVQANGEIEALRGHLAILRDQVETDPLSVCLDSDREVSLRIEALRGRVSAWFQQRRQVEMVLQRAWLLLQQITEEWRTSNAWSDVVEKTNSTPLNQETPYPAPLQDMAQWLHLLEAAWKEGRWQTVGNGLDRWLKATHDYLNSVQTTIGEENPTK